MKNDDLVQPSQQNVTEHPAVATSSPQTNFFARAKGSQSETIQVPGASLNTKVKAEVEINCPPKGPSDKGCILS